jgi:subtilisin family serine protease
MRLLTLPLLLGVMFIPAPIASANVQGLIDMTRDSYNLIGLNEVHKEGITGKGQVVVFIDHGVERSHPYLQEAMIDGFCSAEIACGSFYLKDGIDAGGLFGNFEQNPHGMLVGGVIAGRPNGPYPGGVAPGAQLISISNAGGNDKGLVRAFDWILEAKKRHNIVAVVGSFGQVNSADRNSLLGCSGSSSEVRQRIESLIRSEIAMVFAAGNGGNYLKADFPACIPGVITVGATSSRGMVMNYSNTSATTLLAPADVLTATRNSGYYIGGGTSTAAPVVGGAIALLKQANPGASVDEIKKALFTTNKYADDLVWSNLPILDIPTALKALREKKYGDSKVAISRLLGVATPEQLQSFESQISIKNDELKSQAQKLAQAEQRASVLALMEQSAKAEAEELKKRATEQTIKIATQSGEIASLRAEISKLSLMTEKLSKKLAALCKQNRSSNACKAS